MKSVEQAFCGNGNKKKKTPVYRSSFNWFSVKPLAVIWENMKFDRISFISSYRCVLRQLPLACWKIYVRLHGRARIREKMTKRDTKGALKMTRQRWNRVCGCNVASWRQRRGRRRGKRRWDEGKLVTSEVIESWRMNLMCSMTPLTEQSHQPLHRWQRWDPRAVYLHVQTVLAK